MATLYRSTDSGAPVLTYAADALNALLKACLVDGYGAKAAAGWVHTVLDGATNKYAFSQGPVAGKAVRHLYLYDPADYQAQMRACSAFTISATPVLSDSFGSNGPGTDTVMHKIDQGAVGGVAEWFMVADARRFALFVKREGWKGVGWSAVIAGDMDSIYPDDKGAFSLFGRFTGDPNLVVGASPDITYLSRGCGMGGVTGINAPIVYDMAKQLTGSNYNGKHDYSGVTLTAYLCNVASALRGVRPFVLEPVADAYSVSPYIFPDGYELTLQDGRVFKYLRVGFTSTPERLFVHIGGAGF